MPDGRIEILDSGLESGSLAEVVVYYAKSSRNRLASWESLRESLHLGADSASRWIEDARAERASFGSRL